MNNPAIILVVDDFKTNRFLMASQIRHHNKNAIVFELNSAEECLTVYDELMSSSHEIDLILMDILMPSMDGDTCAKLLREKGYGGKMVAVTAEKDFKDEENYFDNVFLKPVQSEQMHSLALGL